MKEASELYFPDETMINETWHFWQPTLIYDEKGFYSKRGQASAWELSKHKGRAENHPASWYESATFFGRLIVVAQKGTETQSHKVENLSFMAFENGAQWCNISIFVEKFGSENL